MLRATSLIGFGSGTSSAGGYNFVQSSESEWSGTLSHYTFNGANVESKTLQNFGIRTDDTFSGDFAYDSTWAVDIPDTQGATGVFNNAEPTAAWSGTVLDGNLINMGTNNSFWWIATSSTNMKMYSGGTLDATIDMPDVNDVTRYRRSGGTFTFEHDTGGNGVFSVAHTFTGTNSSDTFRIHLALYAPGDDLDSVQWGNAN